MKLCSKCGENRSASDFYKDNRTKNGFKSECKFCHSEYKKQRYKNKPEIAKTEYLRRCYGITFEDKQNMMSEQNDACDICKKGFINEKDSCVDHCHNTGKIRSVLCQKCNKLLGCAEDNVETLRNAIQYLLTHQQER